jgi:hypothetical protein
MGGPAKVPARPQRMVTGGALKRGRKWMSIDRTHLITKREAVTAAAKVNKQEEEKI